MIIFETWIRHTYLLRSCSLFSAIFTNKLQIHSYFHSSDLIKNNEKPTNTEVKQLQFWNTMNREIFKETLKAGTEAAILTSSNTTVKIKTIKYTRKKILLSHFARSWRGWPALDDFKIEGVKQQRCKPLQPSNERNFFYTLILTWKRVATNSELIEESSGCGPGFRIVK